MTTRHSDAAVLLGRRLRERRRELNLSLENVAALTSMHWTSIGKIERGQVHPSVETLVRQATALDTDPGIFVAALDSSMYPKRSHTLTAADFIRERQSRSDEPT